MSANPATNIKVRKASERGHANHGWLDSHFTFSFADYQDPKYMGFRSLRVINEDHIAPGKGFGLHPHKDMEIITYVIAGELKHQDNIGNSSVIKAGHIQKMSAGSGVTHSEFNPSATSETHLLQIWIVPAQKNLKPSYQEMNAARSAKKNGLLLVASDEIRKEGVIKICQDASLYLGRAENGETLDYETDSSRGLWIQMINGALSVNGVDLKASDGAAIEEQGAVEFIAGENSEFLLFDLGSTAA